MTDIRKGFDSEKFLKDRTSSGIDVVLYTKEDIDKSNYEIATRSIICLLLKHFGIKDIDPKKIKNEDLLLHLANQDNKILTNLNSNIPHHFDELGTLDNPEILDTPNNKEELTVQHAINYVVNSVEIDVDNTFIVDQDNNEDEKNTYLILIKHANTDRGMISFIENYIDKDDIIVEFGDNNFTVVEDIENIFLEKFKQLKWDYLKTIILTENTVRGNADKEYWMIFQGEPNISQTYYREGLLGTSDDLNSGFEFFDLSDDNYQTYYDGEYDSGSMEFGYGAPPEEIEKIKKSLGL